MSRTAAEFHRHAIEFPVLSADDESFLLRKISEGVPEAQDALIKHNARRLIMFANEAVSGVDGAGRSCNWSRHLHGVLSVDDCLMIAAEALILAAKKFDPNRYSPIAKTTVRFGSWANFIIKQKLRNALAKEGARQTKWAFESLDADITALESYIEGGCKRSRLTGTKFVVDPEVEIAREMFWSRCEELLGADDVKALQDFCCRQQTRSEASKAWRASQGPIARLQERMSEEELVRFYRILMA